jgi:predicted ATPase/DNA-binding CsgD family transcriptional regulator
MAPPAPHALPVELTSFVGRRAEMAELRRVLGASRLVTLTGPGGVGKTRLATRVAAESAARYRDGIVLVELANVREPGLVPEAVGSALGAHGQAQSTPATLVEYLAGQRLLLILDNCEHVVDEVATLAGALLRACPDLRILATSRQALGIGGETVVAVLPMGVPDPGVGGAAAGQPTDAVELFLDRTGATGGAAVELTDATRPLVVELCRRLDGIPLAIELAAVRVRTLGLETVLAGLDRPVVDLGTGDRSAPPRQRTLEGAIDWSYQLLTEPERLLWARLSVFAGGFELDAAQRVCADEADGLPPSAIPGLLAGLVDRSLVGRETRAGRPRFQMLEVLRAVARDRLEASGEAGAILHRHAHWIADLAGEVGANDARQPALFGRARAERANIWAALQHCVAHPEDAAYGIAICRDLWTFWHLARPVSEVVRLLESLAALVPAGSLAHATALRVAAAMEAIQRDLEPAEQLAVRALELGRKLGDADIVAWSIIARSHLRIYGERWAEADAMGVEAHALTSLMAMPFASLVTVYTLASTRRYVGDLDAAAAHARQAVAQSEQLGETWIRSYALNLLGQVALGRGNLAEGERLARTALGHRRVLGDGVGMRHSLELIVEIAALRGAWARAGVLAGAADSVWRSIAGRAERPAPPAYDELLARIRATLGATGYDEAYRRGLGLGPDEAIEYALADGGAPAAPRAARRSAGPLSPRELEVARLVADGASNSETAARLFISERTVESHVASILNKLGLSSRVQVARWVATLDAAEA